MRARTLHPVLRSKVVFRRVIWIVLDSVGIGAMPDAAEYGDPPGADTLGNIARIRGLKLPNFARLGLGNIKPLAGIAPAEPPAGSGPDDSQADTVVRAQHVGGGQCARQPGSHFAHENTARLHEGTPIPRIKTIIAFACGPTPANPARVTLET